MPATYAATLGGPLQANHEHRRGTGLWPPALAAKLLLLGEILALVAVLECYLWKDSWLPRAGVLLDVGVYAFVIVFPLITNGLHGVSRREAGLRLDNLGPALRAAGLTTLILTAGVVAFGLLNHSFQWHGWAVLFAKSQRYILWGPAQQFLMNSFLLVRLRRLGVSPPLAAVASATIFGLVHLPNWTLVVLTTFAGTLWCLHFLRRPNILAVGLSHGILAVVLYHAWPVPLHHNLTIGSNYSSTYQLRMAQTHWNAGRLGLAEQHFRAAMEHTPADPGLLGYLAAIRHRQGRELEAVEMFEQSLAMRAMPPTADRMAWILADPAHAELQDSERAVRLAEWTCRQTNFSQPMLLVTLAVAYASQQRLDEAHLTLRKAASQLDGLPTPRLRNLLQTRLVVARYKLGMFAGSGAGL